MTASEQDAARGRWWVWIALALLLIGLALGWLLLPIDAWLMTFRRWIEGFRPWGIVIYALVYVAAALLLVPEAPLTIAAGVAFGGWAFPLVYAAAVVGASLAFLVARHVVRRRVAALIEARPRWQAIDRAVGEEGWRIVVLLRLSPVVPFNLQNYFFGATEIAFWPYAIATAFGIVPGTALYVYLGVLGMAAASGEAGETLKWALFGVGLLATALSVALIARKAKRKLKEMGVAERTS